MSRQRLPLRVTVDATPLLGTRTGIGRYTEHLLEALGRRADLRVAGMAFSLRGWRELPSLLPAGVHRSGWPVPATVLRRMWRRVPFPPVELLGSRPDVVHGTNFVLPVSWRAAGVLTIHDLAYLTHPDTVDEVSAALVQLVPRGLSRARIVLTTTGITADAVTARYGFPRDRILVAPLGIDPTWFSAAPPDAALRARLGLPERYVLFTGTREPRKGLATLLDAYARLRASRPDTAGLVLAGTKGWGSEVDLSAAGVRVLGYVEAADLQRVTAGAAAVVLPSVDEGFGLPAVDALAAGVPVVVSDIPVLREVTGGFASTFPVGDPDALSATLAEVLNGRFPDRDEARRFVRRYTWDRCADATAAAYHRAATE